MAQYAHFQGPFTRLDRCEKRLSVNEDRSPSVPFRLTAPDSYRGISGPRGADSPEKIKQQRTWARTVTEELGLAKLE